MTLYDELGVKPDASPDDIKRAYRKQAAECHPDHGGDEDKFKSVSLAYRVLSNDDKRKRYDAGETAESIDSPGNEQGEATQLLVSIYHQLIDRLDDLKLQSENLMTLVEHAVKGNRQEATNQMDAVRRKITTFELVMKRTRVKSGDNLLTRTLADKVGVLTNMISTLERQSRIAGVALEMLKNYEYEFTPQPKSPQQNFLDALAVQGMFGFNP